MTDWIWKDTDDTPRYMGISAKKELVAKLLNENCDKDDQLKYSLDTITDENNKHKKEIKELKDYINKMQRAIVNKIIAGDM